MLYKLLFLAVLLTGCSQSDEKSTDSEWKPNQEVIVINGHTLPPEPNPAINNATLLGVDSNENGVRDDVEIYIYKRFRNFENSRKDRAIAMQYAKATQIIIQNPENAYENKTYLLMLDAHYCKVYVCDIEANGSWDTWLDYSLKHKVFDEHMKDVIFNTKRRLEAYLLYNDALSGHVFDDENATKDNCLIDIDTLGNE